MPKKNVTSRTKWISHLNFLCTSGARRRGRAKDYRYRLPLADLLLHKIRLIGLRITQKLDVHSPVLLLAVLAATLDHVDVIYEPTRHATANRTCETVDNLGFAEIYVHAVDAQEKRLVASRRHLDCVAELV